MVSYSPRIKSTFAVHPLQFVQFSMASSSISVAFLVPYPPGRAPSQRFRVENFLPLLDAAGIRYRLLPFMDAATWADVYKSGSTLRKVLGIMRGYLRRIGHLFIAARAGYVFVHREASPLGPPVFEWLLAKVFCKRLIFDFDDAIWIAASGGKHDWANRLKCHWKIGRIIGWSHMVAGGNDYLCNYAREFNPSVVRIPTVVDTDTRYDGVKEHMADRKVVVGWTGSHSTLIYLQDFSRTIAELQRELDFTFLVIADQVPDLPIPDMQFMPWRPETEIDDLLRMDIGVMPLFEDPWSEGKCGFKLIQYLALGIPALATPIGVNQDIIEDGSNGYLCGDSAEWKARLRELISNRELRQQLGETGREKIVAQFSISSQRSNFLKLFRSHM